MPEVQALIQLVSKHQHQIEAQQRQIEKLKDELSKLKNRSSHNSSVPPSQDAPTQIVEANGWMINDKGEVVLTATAPSATLDIPWLPESGCNAPEPSS